VAIGSIIAVVQVMMAWHSGPWCACSEIMDEACEPWLEPETLMHPMAMMWG
jgi:hypothetical protein